MSISQIASSNYSFTNSTKGSSRPSNPDAKYVGIITRIDGSRVILKIPKLNAVMEFGPCDVYCDFPEVGDSVVCGYLDGRYEHIVVFAKKNDGKKSSSVIENQVFS